MRSWQALPSSGTIPARRYWESALDIYGGREPRSIPTYTFDEAARYLRAPLSTLRSWARGQQYRTLAGPQAFEPVIECDDPDRRLLSFTNLVELHVLARIRRSHRIPLPKVRQAVQYVGQHLGDDHPLAGEAFVTDGVDLLIEHLGRLVAVSAHGQMVNRDCIVDALNRIERDEEGLPARLFPYTRQGEGDSPRLVVVDPLIAFGRLVLVGTGIPTAIVAERFRAGEEVASLASDYGLVAAEIEEAIRCELPLAA